MVFKTFGLPGKNILLALNILFWGCCWPVLGQQFHMTHYGIADGLPNSAVRSIAQDSSGQMYFGTNNGLCIYDGSVMKLLDLPGPGNERPVFPISRLENGKLFITYGGNTNYFWVNNGKVVESGIPNKNVIERVYDDMAAFPILCTNQGVFKVDKGKILKIPLGLESQDRMVSGLLKLDENRFFVARKGYRQALVSGTDFRLLDESDSPLHVNDLARDMAGNIWLATETLGLMLVDEAALKNNQIQFKQLPAPLIFLADKKEGVLSLAVNPHDSSVLIGTADRGLIIYKPDGEVIRVDHAGGLSSNRVNAVYVGGDNIIWMGTNEGVDKISNTDVVIYGKSFDSGSDNVYTINTDCKGRLWFFKNDFMYYFEGKEIKKLPYPAGLEKIPLSCANTRDGFWVSLPNALIYIDCRQKATTITKVVPVKEIYRCLIQWENDAVLAGSDVGIRMISDGKIIPVTDSLKMARSFLKDRFGKLWVGTYDNGLYRFEMLKHSSGWYIEQLYRYFDGNKTYNRYLALLEDSKGYIFAANKFNGLYVFSNSNRRSTLLTRLNKSNGLASNDISCMFLQKNGTVWYGTISGLNQMRFVNGRAIGKSVNKGDHLYNHVGKLLILNGYLWAATEAGLYRIKQREPVRHEIPVYFKEIQLPSGLLKLYAKDTTISLKSSQNTFAVSFTAPFFVNEDQTQYHYRLISEQSNGTWSKIAGNNSINFSGLKNGHYILQLKAVAFNGISNSLVSSLKFYVKKPFYLQAWFLLLWAFLIFLFLYAIYKWRFENVKKLFNVRNSISKNLHDEIGAMLSSINIYSDIARTKTENNQEANSLMSKIYEGSQQALESINDIVWYVNPRNDNYESIWTKMQDFAVPLLDVAGIDVVFESDEKLHPHNLSMQVRQNVYRVFKEAIENIEQHSSASKATIKLSRSGNYLTLRIEDDGVGFNPVEIKKGNGLNNMLYRAGLIGGVLNVQASAGKGCRIELFFPIT